MPLYEGSLRTLLPTILGDNTRIQKIIEQLLDAVEHAHLNGIIHRDLKPENILYEKEDIVVSDFGLGRRLDAGSTRKTYTGQFLGTPFYMAPEQQIDAKKADERSDIYSIGRIIYELYTGDAPSAQQDLSRLDGGMRHIVSKCTKSDPGHRYQTVAELRGDYELLTGGLASKRLRDDVQQILASLVTGDPPSTGEIEDLHRAFFPLREDVDLVHEVFMSLPPRVFVAYLRIYPELVRDLLRRFMLNIAETGWPFDYCDKIANVLRRLFLVTEDTELRVGMLVTLLELGVSHNRFHVMDVFEELLKRVIEPGEVLAVRDALSGRRSRLSDMKDRLGRIALAEPIRELVAEL